MTYICMQSLKGSLHVKTLRCQSHFNHYTNTSLNEVKALLNAKDNIGLRGESTVLKALSVRGGNISTGHTDHRGIKVVEGLRLHDASSDLSTNAALGPATLDGDNMVGLLNRVHDGLSVKRTERTEVDDLSVNTLLGKLLGSPKSDTNHNGVSKDRNIRALALDLGLADGNDEVGGHNLIRDRELNTIHQLVLKNDNRVRITDGGLEETLGILSVVWRHHLEARAVRVPGGKALRVLSTHTLGVTVRTTEHNGDLNSASRHVVSLSGRVNDLINSLHGEVEGHELANRLKASHGSANGKTSKTHLGNGGVQDTLRTELVQETLGNLVGTIVLGDLLTNNENLIISLHFFLHGVVQGFTNSELVLSENAGGAEASRNEHAIAASSSGGGGHGLSCKLQHFRNF
eukprot:Colp12_sorted_trinity150504_noHs@3256